MHAGGFTEAHRVCLRIMEQYAEDVRARPWGDFADFMFDTSLRLQAGAKSVAVMDRVAVPNGVEMRHPLYDADLHTFACTLPAAWKGAVAGSQVKQALREAFRNDLPASVLERDVMGFSSLYWSGSNDIPQLSKRLLTREAFERTEFLDPDAAVRVIEEDRSSTRKSAGKRTWGLLVLQAWLDTWILKGALLGDLAASTAQRSKPQPRHPIGKADAS